MNGCFSENGGYNAEVHIFLGAIYLTVFCGV